MTTWFCNAYASWQKGGVENANGRLRRWLPRQIDIPVNGVEFDLIYAFSVYTHLSTRTAIKTLATIRRYTKPGGLAMITIRPVEFWNTDRTLPPARRAELQRLHREKGFAHVPLGWPGKDGIPTYGHTSMTLEWLDRNAGEWKRVAIDRHLGDAYQLYVILQAV